MRTSEVRIARGQGVTGKATRRRRLERLLQRHGQQLEAWRQILRRDLPAMAADVRDAVEDSVDHLARAVGVAVVEASSSTVRGIESALSRLKSGRYGDCQDCGSRIPSSRLRVLPFAVRCRECQEECETPGSPALPAPSY